jgi:hypothetical protein
MSQTAFKGEKEYAEALRGLLNTGHRQGGKSTICVGQGAEMSYKDFSTFCPKAIAGIGKLPDTVADRSLPIRLERRAPGEQAERFVVARPRSTRACCESSLSSGRVWFPSWRSRGPTFRPSLTIVPRIRPSHCSPSPIWPGATGQSGRGGRLSSSTAAAR